VSLPATASISTQSSAFDTTQFQQHRDVGLCALVAVPAFTATQLPNAATLTVAIQTSNDASFSSGVTTLESHVVTGAGGIGAAAVTAWHYVTSQAKRYVRAQFTSGVGTVIGANITANFSLSV
jgi:D-arabinose 1-dehydrogenase-like Zn-dependent alcohol dehydrogenase